MISTLIFDYGHVLAYPVTGNWFMTPNTKKIIGISNYLQLLCNYKNIDVSFREAYEYLNKNHLVHTEQEEYLQFTEFYRIFFKSAGIKKDMTAICEKLSKDIVYNDSKIRFYPDVFEKLDELKKEYKIIILSDTWPSLKRILDNNGILPTLDGLIMSCDYGETKENTRLFEITLSSHDLTPEECIFVDDSISNLENAERVGLNPILMDRKNKISTSKYPVVKNINDLMYNIL